MMSSNYDTGKKWIAVYYQTMMLSNVCHDQNRYNYKKVTQTLFWIILKAKSGWGTAIKDANILKVYCQFIKVSIHQGNRKKIIN